MVDAPYSFYDNALAYAEGGILVFPCAPGHRGGKVPLTGHGHKDATADPAWIRRWADQFPDANIGAPTGANGWTILDIDTDSRDDIARIVAELEIPRTALARTGKGHHVYFKAVEKVRPSVNIMDHVDVRSGESFVILPPSIHTNGRPYRWQVPLSEIADMPEAIISRLMGRSRTKVEVGIVGPKLLKGSRRPEMFRIARALTARGVVEEAVLVHLRAVNAGRCDPLLPEEELVKLAQGSEKYGHLTGAEGLPREELPVPNAGGLKVRSKSFVGD